METGFEECKLEMRKAKKKIENANTWENPPPGVHENRNRDKRHGRLKLDQKNVRKTPLPSGGLQTFLWTILIIEIVCRSPLGEKLSLWILRNQY